MKKNRSVIKSKAIILFICFGFFLPLASAQEQAHHEISLGTGVGYSTLSMNKPIRPTDVNYKKGAGLHGSFHWTFFLGRQFGIGTGVELAHYNSKYTSTALQDSTSKIRDPRPNPLDEEAYYIFHYKYDHWEEQESAIVVQIPLFLQFQTLGEYQFYIQAGGKIGQAIQSTSTITASYLETKGYFSYENVEYRNLPGYGFRTSPNYKRKQKLDLQMPSLIASVEMGVKWQLENNNAFYTGLFMDYGINNLLKSDTMPLVEYRYPDYISENSITMTSSVNKIQTFAVGVKVHFAFSVGKTFGMLPAKMANLDPLIFDTPPTPIRDDIPLDAQTYRMPDKPKPQPQPRVETGTSRNRTAVVENTIPQPHIENESLKPSLTPPTEQRRAQQPVQQMQQPVQQIQQPVQQPVQQAQSYSQSGDNVDESAEMMVRRLFAAEGIGSVPSSSSPQFPATSPFENKQVDRQQFGGAEYYNPTSGTNTRMTPDRRPTQEDLVILGGPILGYTEGEARFSITMASELDKKAEILKKYPQLILTIETYSCNSPNDRPVGWKRAENLKEYLVLKGVDPNRITTNYRGSIDPVAPNDKESNRRLNRRALFIIRSQ